jgi:hypothetical protein
VADVGSPEPQGNQALDDMEHTRAKAHQVKVDVRKDAKELQQRGQEMLDEQMAHVSAVIEAGKAAVQG